jgi:hypothetical protein
MQDIMLCIHLFFSSNSEDATNAPEVIKIVRELLAASYELLYQKIKVEKQY